MNFCHGKWCEQIFYEAFCDRFLLISSFDIAIYADDNTLYISGPTKDLVKTESVIFSTNPFKWCRYNHMKSNPDECYLLFT